MQLLLKHLSLINFFEYIYPIHHISMQHISVILKRTFRIIHIFIMLVLLLVLKLIIEDLNYFSFIIIMPICELGQVIKMLKFYQSLFRQFRSNHDLLMQWTILEPKWVLGSWNLLYWFIPKMILGNRINHQIFKQDLGLMYDWISL